MVLTAVSLVSLSLLLPPSAHSCPLSAVFTPPLNTVAIIVPIAVVAVILLIILVALLLFAYL